MKKQAKLSCELSYAIEQVYLWRRGTNKGIAFSVFERMIRGEDLDYIYNMFPDLYVAFDLWSRSGDENKFFKLNGLKQDQ